MCKKMLLITFALLSIASITFAAYVEIGTGTYNNYYIPFRGSYDYSWSQVIYLQSEIGSAIDINKISYNVSNSPSNYTMYNQKIYMKHTTETYFYTGAYDDPVSAGFTQVYNGTVTWDDSGWHDITFDTPFSYNGTDNLIVYWQNWDGSGAYGYPRFYYTSHSNRAKYKYQNGSFPAVSGYRTYRAANIRLHFTPVEPAILLSANSYDFGLIQAGSSASWDVTITNDGGSDLIISGATVNTPFSCTYSGTISPGETDTATVYFSPSAKTVVTNYTETLTFNSNAVYGDSTIVLTGGAYYNMESFEGSFPPLDWSIQNIQYNDWVQYYTINAYDGDYCAKLSSQWSYPNYYSSISRLVTPKLSICSDDTLMFYAKKQYIYDDSLKIQISSDGTNFTDVESFNLIDSYELFKVDLSSFVGQYYIGFYGTTAPAYSSIYLDFVLLPQFYYDIPATPTNPVPPDSATCQPVSGILDWDDCQYATSYDVYLEDTYPPNVLIADSISHSDTLYAGLDYNKTYYWKVVANGPAGSSDTTWSFSTVNPCPGLPITEDFEPDFDLFANAPGNDVDWTLHDTLFVSPTHSAHNAYGSSNENVLIQTCIMDLTAKVNAVLSFWHIAKTEDPYDKCYIEISTDAGSNWSAFPASTYYGSALDYDTKGYFDEDSYADWTVSQTPDNTWWKLEFFNLTDYNAYSEVMIRFRLSSSALFHYYGWLIDDITIKELTAPDPPLNPQPADGQTNVDIEPTLSWINNGLIDSSVVWFGDITKALVPVDTIIGTGNTYTPSTLDFNTLYQWKVVNYNQVGNNSATTPTWTFTTNDGAPKNPFPEDGATDVYPYVIFDWEDITGIDSFRIYIGTTIHGNDIVNGELVTESEYEHTTEFALGDTFFWYAESYENSKGLSRCIGTSADWSFSTPPLGSLVEGFEDSENLPFDWFSIVNSTSGSATVEIHTSAYNAHTGIHSVKMTNYNDASAELYLVTPEVILDSTNSSKLKFWFKSINGSTLIVGTIDLTDTTFIPVDTLTASNGDYNQYIVEFSGYADTTRLAFKHGLAWLWNNIYIDDIIGPQRYYGDISFTLTPISQEGLATPGDTITYTLFIENTGDTTDTYDIAVSDNTWPTTSSVDTISVATGVTDSFTVDVIIPTGTPEESVDNATITVTSQTNPAVTHDATITTTAHTPDNQEPNNTFATATDMGFKANYFTSDSSTEIYPDDDLDYYKFNATAGQILTATMAIDGYSDLNGGIALYDASYTELVDIDNGESGEDEEFIYTLPSSGMYYILCAYHYDVPRKGKSELTDKANAKDTRAASGDYLLDVTVQNPPVFSVTPTTISTTVDTGSTDMDTLTVENTGEYNLTYFASHCTEYFEADSGRYDHSGTNDLWEWGSVDYSWGCGPAHSGSNVWGINLTGGNLLYSYCYLQTPEIDLNASVNPELKFWHWYYDFQPYYRRNVKVSTDGGANWELIYPDGGYPVDKLNSANSLYREPGYAGTSEGWETATFDLSSFVDSTLLIRWYFRSSLYYVFKAGWFIDDVEVTGMSCNSWLTINGSSGIGDTLSTGSDEIVVGFSTVGILPGVYTEDIIFAHNADSSPDTVHVTMTVPGGQPDPPDSVNIEIVDNGDSIRISWHNEYLTYKIYSSDNPYAAFPDTTSWTLEATVTNVGEVTIPAPASDKKFYVVTADNSKDIILATPPKARVRRKLKVR